MKAKRYRLTLLVSGTAFLAVLICLGSCTIVLSQDVGGTSSGSGGVLDPMMSIFEDELNGAYDASRALLARDLGPASRGLAGGANSILHGLPSTTVAKVKAKARAIVAASGLEKSRDLEKVAPAIAAATATALKDPSVIGDTPLAETELVQVNAVASRGIAKSLNASGVSALAEGLGTETEKRGRLEALTRAASANSETLGISTANLGDALQKVLLMVVDAGNPDVDAAGTGAAAPETILAERTSALVRIAATALDGKLTGADCSAALNDLANAAVVGLGNTAITKVVESAGAKLQSVVQDGVLAGLFTAYYQFSQNVGLSASALRAAINFTDAANVVGTGTYADHVSTNVQAALPTIVPAADAKAKTAAVIDTSTPPANDVANATPAGTSIASGNTSTWTAGSAFRVSSSLAVSGNLVIEPGVTVYLDDNVNISIGSTGSIRALGTQASPIVFTRAVSGNDWGSIRINSNSSLNSLEYCDISGAYMGVEVAYSSSDAGIVSIDHCLFHGNTTNGLECGNAKVDLGRMTTVRNCFFYGNGSYPVLIDENVDIDASSHFYDPAVDPPEQPSGLYNAICLTGNLSIGANRTFSATEVPYYVPYNINGGVNVASPAILTLKPGVVFKFAAGMDLAVYDGAKIIAGEAGGSQVIFTSYRDGSVGGDTFGQGNAGAVGDWSRVDVMGSGSEFVNCEFRYAAVGLDFNEDSNALGSATVAHCVFHDNSCGLDGTEAMAGTSVSTSAFYDNASFPVYVNAQVDFDASNSFHDPAQTAPPVPAGSYNAVCCAAHLNINVSRTFAVTEVPYYVPYNINGGLYTSGTAILTIKPGATFKFASGMELASWDSSKIIAGEAGGAPVVFTSYRDGSVGGDTIGQGATAAAGDWDGVDLMTSQNSFVNCDFRFAGVGLDFNEASNLLGSAAVDGCFFRSNSRGIDATEARTGTTITGSAFNPSLANGTTSWDIDYNGNTGNVTQSENTNPSGPLGAAFTRP